MLVKLKNDWFDGATYHPKNVVFEYNGDPELLPKGRDGDGHIIISQTGSLPVASNSPKAGFGAKPLEEQIMDMVGAGPTHQIDLTGTSNSGESLSKSEQRDEEKDSSEQRETERKEASKEAAADRKEEAKGIAEGLKKAETAAEKVLPTIDPFAADKPKK